MKSESWTSIRTNDPVVVVPAMYNNNNDNNNNNISKGNVFYIENLQFHWNQSMVSQAMAQFEYHLTEYLLSKRLIAFKNHVINRAFPNLRFLGKDM